MTKIEHRCAPAMSAGVSPQIKLRAGVATPRPNRAQGARISPFCVTASGVERRGNSVSTVRGHRKSKTTARSATVDRVAQPPRRSAPDEACPEGVTRQGRLFFGFFLLARQKKEPCRRATPGQRTPAPCGEQLLGGSRKPHPAQCAPFIAPYGR